MSDTDTGRPTRHDVDLALGRAATDWSSSDVDILAAEVRALRAELEQADHFGRGEFRVTQWAYDQALRVMREAKDEAAALAAHTSRPAVPGPNLTHLDLCGTAALLTVWRTVTPGAAPHLAHQIDVDPRCLTLSWTNGARPRATVEHAVECRCDDLAGRLAKATVAPLPAVPDGPTLDAEASLTPAELRVHAATLRAKGYHGAALSYEGMADFSERVAASPGPTVYCDDMAGPSGVGGPCVLPPGHPHVDGIGGKWPAVLDGEDAPTFCDCTTECGGVSVDPTCPTAQAKARDGEDVPARLDAAAEMRPGVCPTCSSAQPHLHPTRDLCADTWHEPMPATSGEWRSEMSRWAGLVEQIADGAAGVEALYRVAAGMRRQSETAPARPAGGQE